MAKDVAKLIIKANDAAAWDEVMELSEKTLLIVDCCQDWCGYCEALIPTFNRLYLDYDAADERLTIVAGNITKIGPLIQSTFPADTAVSLDKVGCLPVFAFYRVSPSCLGSAILY
jgi:thiol-disulfide isomerase/thioredoxin